MPPARAFPRAQESAAPRPVAGGPRNAAAPRSPRTADLTSSRRRPEGRAASSARRERGSRPGRGPAGGAWRRRGRAAPRRALAHRGPHGGTPALPARPGVFPRRAPSLCPRARLRRFPLSRAEPAVPGGLGTLPPSTGQAASRGGSARGAATTPRNRATGASSASSHPQADVGVSQGTEIRYLVHFLKDGICPG